MELTITTNRSKQWSRTLYVVDDEIFDRIFQILKENNESIPQSAQQSVHPTGGNVAVVCNCHPSYGIHSSWCPANPTSG
jgi:hypothetical protein